MKNIIKLVALTIAIAFTFVLIAPTVIAAESNALVITSRSDRVSCS